MDAGQRAHTQISRRRSRSDLTDWSPNVVLDLARKKNIWKSRTSIVELLVHSYLATQRSRSQSTIHAAGENGSTPAHRLDGSLSLLATGKKKLCMPKAAYAALSLIAH